MVCCARTRGDGFNLKDGRFRLDIRMKLCTRRVARHWHRLSTAAVDSSALETFKVWMGL